MAHVYGDSSQFFVHFLLISVVDAPTYSTKLRAMRAKSFLTFAISNISTMDNNLNMVLKMFLKIQCALNLNLEEVEETAMWSSTLL